MRCRANPQIELKRLEELADDERAHLQDLERDADFFGLFVPRPPLRINIKSVNRQAAELFQRLSTPAQFDDADDEMIDLVLDRILELESDGEFVSGADALAAIGSSPAAPAIRDEITRASRDALLHAQDLETDDSRALAMALYDYNRIPISPFWKTRFADRDAILAHVGADTGALRRLLEREWSASSGMSGWIYWSSRTPAHSTPDEPTYKLYVSPRPERVRDAFDVFVRVLSASPVPFKIGDGAAGLLRPDKFVAYFTTREALDDVAATLRRELAGCDAHGVPFTAGLDERGLLSWGIDPPDSERVLQWMARDSWRFWIAQRLGSALAIAKTAHRANAVEPWRFAIERVRRFGVDVETWTPSATLWSRS